MGGFVLDIYVEFFFRSILNLWRGAVSSHWLPVTATIISSNSRANGMGCYVVKVEYRYKLLGERYTGVHKEPFLSRNYRDDYLRHSPGGSKYPIRVNPGDCSKSVPIRGEDGVALLTGVPAPLLRSHQPTTNAPSSDRRAEYVFHTDADAQ
jgi:hypothetical protein